jgi:two-component system, NarL family, sensor histidine kinase LiaS
VLANTRPITHTSHNLKWFVLRCFVIASFATIAVGVVGWYYLINWSVGITYWSLYILILLLPGLITGYIAAQRLQRELDMLDLTVLQWARGRLSERVHMKPGEPFHRLAGDLNDLADSIEERLKSLRKAAEEPMIGNEEAAEAAVIEERRRLARDLHDTVSQQLFALHMSAAAMPKLLERDDPQTANAMLQQLIQLSQAAQKQMRGLIAQLRPLELEGRTLKEAIEKWFPDYCNQNGLQGSLDLRLEEKERLSEVMEHQFFLIVQEGMANVVKHAAASRVTLTLHDRGDLVTLIVTDNGQGFAPSEVGSGSYGLHTMRERAQKLGGQLEIRTKPGEGTQVHVRIPKLE